MLELLSMVQGANRMVEDLAAVDQRNGVLFKRRTDPRDARVGRFIRRFSLDELLQLVNVLLGDMSRPPLARELERCGDDVRRRFLGQAATDRLVTGHQPVRSLME